MPLLLQLDGDLPKRFAGHERKLYIFGCRRKPCRRKNGSIRGIRASRVAKVETPAESKKENETVAQVKTPESRDLGSTLFGVVAPGFDRSSQPNPFASASASIGNPFAAAPASSLANPFAAASTVAPTPPTIVEPKSSTEAEDKSLAQTFAQKLGLSTNGTTESKQSASTPRPHESWPEKSSRQPAYPRYYLDADYEEIDNPKNVEIPSNVRLVDTEMADGGEASGSGVGVDKQLFESTMDRAFQKFADRVAQNPEQILRYEYDGTPLLYSDEDAIGKALTPSGHAAAQSRITTTKSRGMPNCENCGAKRTFELQLTPHAITELEADEDALEGMDWGTIILGVCSKDCSPAGTKEKEVGYAEEWIGVQWEELSSGKRRS